MGDAEVKERFETMAMQHLDSLYQFALLLARERHLAEDLVHDTYLRAHRFYDRFQCGTNFKAWLFTIMRNLFINGFRQRARELSLADLDGEMLEDEDYVVPPSDGISAEGTILEKGIFRRDIERALNSLPDRLRVVVILRDIEGFEYKEIARILGCPVGTVMSRLWRSRNLLKKSLRAYQACGNRRNGH